MKSVSLALFQALAWRLWIALSFLLAANVSQAQVAPQILERAVREIMPQPMRCGSNAEPFFYCRYETGPEHSLVLELSFNGEGPSGSLTYNYADPRGDEFLVLMGRFFGGLGVPKQAFNECIRQSHWESGERIIGRLKILCRNVELGSRVTYEVFVIPNELAASYATAHQPD